MSVKFNVQTGGKVLPFLHFSMQRAAEGTKTKDKSPDYWGSGFIDPVVLLRALGVPDDLPVGEITNFLQRECQLASNQVPAKLSAWDSVYGTGTPFVSITSNRFVGAEREDMPHAGTPDTEADSADVAA